VDSAPFVPLAADWQRDQAAIRAVRSAVFIREQAIPADLEWDGMDAACDHVLVFDTRGQPVATGRLQPDGRIGRMAVLPGWRGRGIGRAVLQTLLVRAAARGMTQVYLHAQAGAAGFYSAAGFRQQGTPFSAAGIPHVRMIREVC